MTLPPPPSSRLQARFTAGCGTTSLAHLHESGSLRLRRTRERRCEAILVNTGGGIVAGDRLELEIEADPDTDVTLSTVAAEKIYRSEGPVTAVATRLALAAGARLVWAPQETILFNDARLERRLAVELAADARLVALEMLVFGRLASGETTISGSLRDDWRIRRGGRLVFADATRLDGAIGATLDRPAVGGGARATALLVIAAPDADAAVDPLRAVIGGMPGIEAGVSARDGIAVARALAHSPERLREAIVAALGALRVTPPRVWR